MNDHRYRKALVYYRDRAAGILQELPQGYRFNYFQDFLDSGYPAVSVSLPLSPQPYDSVKLFPFFKGLLPEGWYHRIVCQRLKVDPRDEFGLLLACGEGTIGAVYVKPLQEEHHGF